MSKLLLIYDDEYGSGHSWKAWGKQLCAHAKRDSAFEPTMFDAADSFNIKVQRETAYMFARLEQHPVRLATAKEPIRDIAKQPHINSIIHPREYLHYERKDLQTAVFRDDMPDTRVINHQQTALELLERPAVWSCPFVSKSAYGSSSSDVRLIETKEQAVREASLAFSPGGLPTERGRQKDYLIWQELVTGNAYTYRAVIIGSYYWLLRVHNRPNSYFASGSGRYHACCPPFNEEEFCALRAAYNFFTKHNMSWCGIDLLWNANTCRYEVLETTIAWNLRAKGANEACPVVDHCGKPHRKGYYGRDQWKLLLDEIKEGSFG